MKLLIYKERMIPPDEPVSVEGVTIQVLDVTPVGPDLRWRYVIIEDYAGDGKVQ